MNSNYEDVFDMEGPLARGLAKLASMLGVAEEVVDVALGAAAPDALIDLQRAAGSSHQVSLDYYVYGRDTETTRVVDPHLVDYDLTAALHSLEQSLKSTPDSQPLLFAKPCLLRALSRGWTSPTTK